jgi:RES domain-containing protein
LRTREDLIRAVREIELLTLCGLGIRIVGNKYRQNTLGTTGSLKTGGRYNIKESLPDSFGALYLAGDIETAEAEALAQPIRWEKSYYLIIYKLRIVDLRSVDNQARLDTNDKELTRNWIEDNQKKSIAPTQELALAFYKHTDAQALIYASTKRGDGYNLAVFPDKIEPDYYLKSRFFFYSGEEIGQDIF